MGIGGGWRPEPLVPDWEKNKAKGGTGYATVGNSWRPVNVKDAVKASGQTPQQTGSAPDPGKGSDVFNKNRNTAIQPGSQPAVPGNPYGSQSGPGILESWFNQRATGTDPAFEYAAMRGMEDLGNQYGAAGAFNSGAARRGESDFYANLVAQRMGQLDALAGGASGEHQGRLNSMFMQGNQLAGGQAGLSSAYDLGAAGNIQAANQAMNQMALNKAGVDQQGNQSAVNLFTSIFGGRGGGQTR